ncbi:hypothetical protein [Azohydromonas lata]|uniref:Secreted protein n=1 Tax=Azohydromonas lata TaxID=45677 RepID=A0ABU5IIZ3_9BURK|nr:hypothetical protein [Azohydromonas lata]MDZ5458765.1 hypothetical protein [Azohydromonas lata]
MKFSRVFLVFSAGTLAAGLCQAAPTGAFGPIYPSINNTCKTIARDKSVSYPETGSWEMVHFKIAGTVVPTQEQSGGTSRLKFTIETHGEGLGATTGAKYVFDGRMETTVNTGSNTGSNSGANSSIKSTGNAAAVGDKFQFTGIYKISARVHSSENADPSKDNLTIEFPIQVSYADGAAVAWPVNARDDIRLICQPAP